MVDHALNAFSHYPAVKGAKSLGLVSPASPSASSCGILRPMLASERGENGMSNERTERTRATETKRVPVEKALGRKHPHTLTSVNNLVLVLQAQGKYEEAEVMTSVTNF